eukprot:1575319-Pyramimonas_sp.AAC.1
MENHFDDCGGYIQGQGMSSELLTIYEENETYSDDDDDFPALFTEEDFLALKSRSGLEGRNISGASAATLLLA